MTTRHPMPMNLAYASDLHFEYHREDPNWLPALPENADVLVLAGDIDSGADAIESVRRLSDALPDTDIIYVAGNHEF
ncbi:MAG: metallophosphoesterase, partial [Pseudomonadota bacterium]|nr:metallophosphoesterase [Pseudomonadota bacterium]